MEFVCRQLKTIGYRLLAYAKPRFRLRSWGNLSQSYYNNDLSFRLLSYQVLIMSPQASIEHFYLIKKARMKGMIR